MASAISSLILMSMAFDAVAAVESSGQALPV
jgi:hypothetical protein